MDELQKALSIQVGVQPAIDGLNAHDHSGDLGNKIPEEGLKDGAVSTQKIQQGAVTTDCLSDFSVTVNKIANGAISISKLSPDVQFGGGGALGMTNYITEGFKISSDGGLTVSVSAGAASISNKVQRLVSPQTANLTSCMASIIYAQKNDSDDYPTIGVYNAKAPFAGTGSTVVRYVFNNKLNDTTIVETTGNGNDLTIIGGCTLVDGWFDKSIKGDGTTGYMISKNSSGFPMGATSFTEKIIFTTGSLSGVATISVRSNGTVLIYTEGARLKIQGSIDTGIDLEPGKTYYIGMSYNGTKTSLFVSGEPGAIVRGLTFSVSQAINAVTGSLYLLRNTTAANYNNGIVHYYELINSAMTLDTLSAEANACLFQNKYLSSPLTVLPADSIALGFVRTNSSSVFQILDNMSCMIRNDFYGYEIPGVSKEFYGASEPFGYFLSFGQEVSRTLYPNLFDIIGAQYGAGNGTTTFNLPKSNGRTAIARDNMGGVSANIVTDVNADILGGTGGEEKHSLTGDENGPHAHTLGLSLVAGDGWGDNTPHWSDDPVSRGGWAAPGTYTSGSGTPHNNMQPWIACNKIIRY